MISSVSPVLPVLGQAGQGLFGEGDTKGDDKIDVSTGPVTVSTGAGPVFEATDSWVWLMVLGILVVALFKW